MSFNSAEVPKPPSCFEEEAPRKESLTMPELAAEISDSKETVVKKGIFTERFLNFQESEESKTYPKKREV